MRPRRKPLMLVAARWAPLLAGGLALQVNLGGCDPEVKDAVLSGVQTSLTTLVTSVLNAFFLSLQGDTVTTTQPLVKAVVHAASSLLA